MFVWFFYPIHLYHMLNCTHNLIAAVIIIPMLIFASQQLLFVCIDGVFARYI